MISKEPYEILRLLQIPEIDKNKERFYESALEHTFVFHEHLTFGFFIHELFRLKYMGIDKGGKYFITEKGRIAAKEYESSPHKEESFFREDVKPTTQSVTTTPSIKDKSIGIKWYNKPLFTHIIWPLVVGLIILALTLYFTR